MRERGGGRGHLWSPVEEDDEDAEERRHGGRDEMYSSSALHGVLLEGRGKANRICLNGTQKVSVCTCPCMRARPLGETGGRYPGASCASASSASRT